jgi:phospholipase C
LAEWQPLRRLRMKRSILCMLIALGAALASAQTLPHFDHIIIVFQENRTPDNLFGSAPGSSLACGGNDPFEHGVDIENCGHQGSSMVWLAARDLDDSFDPGHAHANWTAQCDAGSGGVCQMDEACQLEGNTKCFSYVPESQVDPYFQIAKKYGFANYMFQTNQGPSFPAHQFIFSGTSAPVPYNDKSGEWTWFAAENPAGISKPGQNTGCTAPQAEYVQLIDNNDSEGSCPGNDPHCGRPCYEHAPGPTYTNGTLADLLMTNNITWKYYTPMVDQQNDIFTYGLWVAPISIGHLCGEQNNSRKCDALLPGGTYAGDMRYETKGESYPLKDDIVNCNLAAVNWGIPDARWSDHAQENNGSGPSYVADIVNALGASTTCDGGKGYWKNTAIFITWDDWGGWFDHVPPFKMGGQTNGWGKYYTYGFRVPLLVVSAYTPAGYVSGALPPYGNGKDAIHTHDFGSILAFIENNFGLTIGSIGPSGYQFADAYAPELAAGVVPLADFFTLTQPQTFAPISVPTGYDASYFDNYFTNNPADDPDGPDADYD